MAYQTTRRGYWNLMDFFFLLCYSMCTQYRLLTYKLGFTNYVEVISIYNYACEFQPGNYCNAHFNTKDVPKVTFLTNTNT